MSLVDNMVFADKRYNFSGASPITHFFLSLCCCWSSGSQLKTVIYAWSFMQHSFPTHSHFGNQQIITVYIIDLVGLRRFSPFQWPVTERRASEMEN